MMFKNDFVAAVKCNGKILREHGNSVYLPFGSEYSILLKNLRSVKASVSVRIDGGDVLNDHTLIIGPDSEMELERFIGSSFEKGNKFKFIEKTEQISEYRGDNLEDGIIRISFRFEKEKPKYTPITIHRDYFDRYRVTTDSVTYSSFSSDVSQSSLNEDGITVPGSVSDQKFTRGTIGPLEDIEHILTFYLRGRNEQKEVISTPLIVKTKLACSMCGKSNKSSHKFCSDCGTSLILF